MYCQLCFGKHKRQSKANRPSGRPGHQPCQFLNRNSLKKFTCWARIINRLERYTEEGAQKSCINHSGTATISVNSLPLVSSGRSITDTPETTITASNRRIAAVWWQPVTSPTATRGHIMPPILPTALTSPKPVALIDVGYIYEGERWISITITYVKNPNIT